MPETRKLLRALFGLDASSEIVSLANKIRKLVTLVNNPEVHIFMGLAVEAASTNEERAVSSLRILASCQMSWQVERYETTSGV